MKDPQHSPYFMLSWLAVKRLANPADDDALAAIEIERKRLPSPRSADRAGVRKLLLVDALVGFLECWHGTMLDKVGHNRLKRLCEIVIECTCQDEMDSEVAQLIGALYFFVPAFNGEFERVRKNLTPSPAYEDLGGND